MESATTSLFRCDAVFVVNRLSSAKDIGRAVARYQLREIVVLSSHQLFPSERASLVMEVQPAQLHLLTFADLFTDPELQACDDAASSALLSQASFPQPYADCFEDTARLYKNRAACEALLKRGLKPEAFRFVAQGLGVDARAWGSDVHRLDPISEERVSVLSHALRGLRGWVRARAQVEPFTVLSSGQRTYLMHGSLHRLALAPSVPASRIEHQAARRMYPHARLGVALHQFHHGLCNLGLPLTIFVDGYLPPNYPRTYLDAYRDADFVTTDPISARWLKTFNQRLAPIPEFLQSHPFAPAGIPDRVETVLILMGHAGDWTCLIHRSDTDIMVAGMLEAAARLPQLEFVFRLHPTMEHTRHEGAGSRRRIEQIIGASGLPNVRISSSTLEADWSRADVFISEYSAALVEAWRKGRLGIAVNLTQRRSFMQIFADLGFSHTNAVPALVRELRYVAECTSDFAERQTRSALRYNQALALHFAELG